MPDRINKEKQLKMKRTLPEYFFQLIWGLGEPYATHLITIDSPIEAVTSSGICIHLGFAVEKVGKLSLSIKATS